MNAKISISYHTTKIGELIIGSFDNVICIIDFRYRKKRAMVDNRIRKFFDADFVESDNEIILCAKRQIDEYLENDRRIFEIPILAVGTDFQMSVWKELQNINYAQTASYMDIAKRIGNPKAFRAVAMANSLNPIALVIPCHRVINSDGTIGGYGGGVEVKRKLLIMEQNKLDVMV